MGRSKRRKVRRPLRVARPTPAATPHEPDLMADVRAALGDGHPLGFLLMVSALLDALDPRAANPFQPEPEPALPALEDLVGSLVDVERRETSALLAVVAELMDDEVTRARIRRALATRGHVLPRWLAELRDAEVGPVSELVHVLGDGDDIVLGVRLPGGAELTIVVYIDHNLGTVVKDAFVLPDGHRVVAELLVANTDADSTLRALDPADARARITEAIEWGARMFPPAESESWPTCRPLVQWAIRRLPEGGTNYQRPEWDDPALAELTERFFGSSFGAALDEPDHRRLLESLLWFGTDYGPGDPLRWSSAAVEILLIDWLPRKIVAEADYLAKAPALLRAFIRFAHAERGIRASLTEETLATVDLYELDYQWTIRSPRRQGAEALLERMGVLGPDPTLLDLQVEFAEHRLASLRRAVGGEVALDRLDDDALPDEPMRWEAIPEDVRDRVAEVAVEVERCCAELLDVEYRTAARRFLARAAAGDPAVFRGRARAATAAAAVCWIIGKVNDVFSPYVGELMVKDLASYFGVSNVSQRAGVLLRAAGFEYHHDGDVVLGSPEFLVSGRRRAITELRDHSLALAEPAR